jgi:hypothetical protein
VNVDGSGEAVGSLTIAPKTFTHNTVHENNVNVERTLARYIHVATDRDDVVACADE